jgi:hypothetical protein
MPATKEVMAGGGVKVAMRGDRNTTLTPACHVGDESKSAGTNAVFSMMNLEMYLQAQVGERRGGV